MRWNAFVRPASSLALLFFAFTIAGPSAAESGFTDDPEKAEVTCTIADLELLWPRDTPVDLPLDVYCDLASRAWDGVVQRQPDAQSPAAYVTTEDSVDFLRAVSERVEIAEAFLLGYACGMDEQVNGLPSLDTRYGSPFARRSPVLSVMLAEVANLVRESIRDEQPPDQESCDRFLNEELAGLVKRWTASGD